MRWGEVLATITCLVLMVVIITNTGVRYAVACKEDAKNGPITYGRSSDSLGRRVAVAPVAVGARRRWLARTPYVPPVICYEARAEIVDVGGKETLAVSA